MRTSLKLAGITASSVLLALALGDGASLQAFPTLPVGQIETVAGNGIGGFAGDGGSASQASLQFPIGHADVDSQGNLYIPDTSNRRVRRVEAQTGVISTFAGNGSSQPSGDGGPATDAALSDPTGVKVDQDDNVFIVDLSRNAVRRVDAVTQLITTVAGGGGSGFSGDGGPATQAQLSSPEGIELDAAGNLFIADQGNDRIRRVDAATGIITTIAGNGQFGFAGDGGLATQAELRFPTAVAVDGAGNVFIADLGNNRIRRVDAATGIITTVAGTGQAGFNGDGIPATQAQLNFPVGVDVDAAGTIYVADTSNHRIRRVDPNTGIITTVAGTGTEGFDGDGGPATAADLNDPFAVAVDGFGNLWITDTDNNRIRRVFLGAPVLEVAIDLKPGSFPNSVNPRSHGLLPVAILTTEELDAREVDPLSVKLGPGAAGIAHRQGHLEDVDGDGDLDLVVHFRTGETGVSCETTELELVGTTSGGQEITGRDSVSPVGCRP